MGARVKVLIIGKAGHRPESEQHLAYYMKTRECEITKHSRLPKEDVHNCNVLLKGIVVFSLTKKVKLFKNNYLVDENLSKWGCKLLLSHPSPGFPHQQRNSLEHLDQYFEGL